MEETTTDHTISRYCDHIDQEHTTTFLISSSHGHVLWLSNGGCGSPHIARHIKNIAHPNIFLTHQALHSKQWMARQDWPPACKFEEIVPAAATEAATALTNFDNYTLGIYKYKELQCLNANYQEIVFPNCAKFNGLQFGLQICPSSIPQEHKHRHTWPRDQQVSNSNDNHCNRKSTVGRHKVTSENYQDIGIQRLYLSGRNLQRPEQGIHTYHQQDKIWCSSRHKQVQPTTTRNSSTNKICGCSRTHQAILHRKKRSVGKFGTITCQDQANGMG